jgi:hypothetical protein
MSPSFFIRKNYFTSSSSSSIICALTERERKMLKRSFIIPLEKLESFQNILKGFKTLNLIEEESFTEGGLYSFSGSGKELNILSKIESKYGFEIWPDLMKY